MTGRSPVRPEAAVGGLDPEPLPHGAFVVSIDTELAWGEAHRRDASQGQHRFEGERDVIAAILDLFARYEIAATWAVVGHLFLEACEDGDGGPHPGLVPPAYDWLGDDWLAVDPCSTLDDAPFWYGRDIVDAILACPVPQGSGQPFVLARDRRRPGVHARGVRLGTGRGHRGGR